jgi:Bifunctional DNA primase/polymerase, N-terminal
MRSIQLQHSSDNPLHAAARDYATRGWPVFACYGMRAGRCTCGKPGCAHPGKHPLTRHGFKDATTDPRQIDQWWTDHPDANVAIATGAASGLIVLDRDPRNGGDLTLGELEAQYGKLPETAVSFTGGGGAHYCFRYREEPIRSGTDVLGPGLDIKSDGGYIIAPRAGMPAVETMNGRPPATLIRYRSLTCPTGSGFSQGLQAMALPDPWPTPLLHLGDPP